jgi:hypothetical protein
MKTKLLACVALLAVLVPHSDVAAHEGGAPAQGVKAEATSEESTVEGRVVVVGRVEALREVLAHVEGWPALFSDARAVSRQRARIWSFDFKGFGHAHPFEVTRMPEGVVLELAQKGHGAGRLEYSLQPLGPGHSTLTVRLSMSTPPQLTQEQVLALLRAKVVADLEDFSRAAPGLVTTTRSILR